MLVERTVLGAEVELPVFWLGEAEFDWAEFASLVREQAENEQRATAATAAMPVSVNRWGMVFIRKNERPTRCGCAVPNRRTSRCGWRAAEKTGDNRDEQQHEEDVEEDAGDVGRRASDTSESKDAGDQGDDEKRDDPAKHDG